MIVWVSRFTRIVPYDRPLHQAQLSMPMYWRVGDTRVSVLGPPGNGETGFGKGEVHNHGHVRESAL